MTMGEGDAQPAAGEDEKAGAEQTSAPDLPREDVARAATTDAPRRRIPWGWIVVVALVVEFGIYGSNGHIEVCVGKEGVHDFDLVGQERNDENRWRFPRCETRMNLGLRSAYEERVEEAVRVACRGATMIQHRGESRSCVEAEAGWIQRISARPCPPWHKHFWTHLFWFLS
jgi:hypothetical protein